ncbi:hypothetical protein EG328_005066 [Venturia inaequalis]|uniref:Enhancer of mRNA-decapping protein 3 n=2 Tax=Venturia inaequalis TaxID=5025 RepID=A0A8H3Z2V6_VENIN|nr:hypothetical protein EG328_005066 [Venturia inaequalis]KAE9981173.1 hypothetical protein EG327_006337 [Venturia inaequalis]
MAAFVGLTIAVTLKRGDVIQGLVSSVDPNTASLVLQDVYFPNTGQHVGNWTVLGHQIADLQVQDTTPPPPPPVHQDHYNRSQPHSQRPSVVPTLHPEASHIVPSIPSPQLPVDAHDDPAILSFGRRPTQNDAFTQQPQEAPSTPAKIASSDIGLERIQQRSSYIVTPEDSGNKKKSQPRRKDKDAAATLKAPFSNLDINSAAEQEHLDVEESDEPTIREQNIRRVSINKTRTGKPMDDVPDLPHVAEMKTRKAKQKTRRNNQAGVRAGLDQNDGEGESSPEVARRGNTNGNFRGKGWRQTPILQEPPSTTNPRRSNVRKLNRRQRMEQEAQNGWATEDVGDIQELPEFDFAENLSKFDKRSVFDQIRTEDTTADEDRLVSFNRTTRPGTYGGKNLHPTEMVLDSPKTGPRRTSTIRDSDSDENFDFDTGRAKKIITSRNSSRRSALRNGNAARTSFESMHEVRVADDTVGQKEHSQALRGLRGNEGLRGSISASSPNPARFTPPESPSMSQTMPGAHFRIATNGRACPTIMPAAMAAIQEVAESELGLSPEIITESAGRGIAEVAMATLGAANGKRTTRDNLRADVRPWAVIVAGNHRAGARALAAARQLRERNIRTLTCIVGFERQNIELIPEVRRQAEILVKMGGTVRGWPDVQNYLKSEGPPEVIIDAFLARSKPYNALGDEDSRAFLEFANWSNRGRGEKSVTLSVDMPSGLNGSTGEFCVRNAGGLENVHVHADHVICIGAPRIGLLKSLQRATVMVNSVKNGFAEAAEKMLSCQVWVVDVGVNRAWKQSGMANTKGVKFGSDWVVPLKLAEGSAEE